MKLHFLGTGTSFGVPVVGCDCETCRSADARDARTRHCVVLEEGDRRILVDTPPELRLQLVASRIRSIDAVWYTHYHADHVHGIDDLRVFSVRGNRALPVYASPACAGKLERHFQYIFDPRIRPLEGTTKPEATVQTLTPYEEVEIAGFSLTPLPVPHGPLQVLGFRCGDLGYITDAKKLPPDTFEALRGVRTLVLNALWYGRPHPTHFTVEEAVEVARSLGAERTFLTHLSHRVRHAELEERLPPEVRPAFDGLTLEV